MIGARTSARRPSRSWTSCRRSRERSASRCTCRGICSCSVAHVLARSSSRTPAWMHRPSRPTTTSSTLARPSEEADILPLAIGSHPAGLVDLFQFLVEVAAPDKIELAERGQAKFTDADLARTFDLIAEVFNTCADTGAIGADIGTVTFPSFYTNQAAMMMQFPGTPLMSDVHSPEFPMTQDLFNNDFATFPFPQSEGLAGTDGGIGILADSENKDAAWQVVKWLVSGKQAERIIAYGQPVAWEALRPARSGLHTIRTSASRCTGRSRAATTSSDGQLCPDVYNTLTSVIPAVVIGQIDAARAAQETQDAFDRGCQNWVQP